MKNKTPFIVLSAVAVPVLALLAGRWLIGRQLRQDVADLFSQADTGPVKQYSPAQLADLPAPVQRYFRHVLTPGQPYLRTVRLKHDGDFKTDLEKDWMSITGEEYFLADKPGYIWIGTTAWFSARDQYVAGHGSLTVRLLSALPIQHGSGPAYDQGELLRWLAETAWFPTSLLPGGPAVWSPVDDQSATLTLTDHSQTVSCLMSFNKNDELVRCEAQRQSDETHVQTWVCRLFDYREKQGVLVPTQGGAAWVVGGVEKPYARFVLRDIAYDQPYAY
ncbi:DUF6544 family protein [Fibrella aquatilis]|uniref:Uncharacterized protein n=1 Tax=Fibrella aquatilis TaxID=2817059 RepID=A0A939G463_9BACT|nr:DUF6544 family protein [Fibrella aquatilis]MBO0930299.1 hypothetical protein [Fibrella aquatilis]